MLRTLFTAALIALPGIAHGQARSPSEDRAVPVADVPAVSAQTQRIRSVTLTKGQKCPPSTSEETVVCGTLEEPYRLPKRFREGPPTAANQSWVNRAASVDQVGRVAGGLPDTCSPVGTGGQSGCALQMNRAFAAERRANAQAAESVP